MTVPPPHAPRTGSRPPGFLGSVKTLASSVLELLHVRVELFALEWHEERERAKHLLVLGVAGVLMLGLGLLLLTFFIIVLFWDSYRLLAIGIVTALYLGGGAWCLLNIRAQVKNHPPPFATSLQEFIEDLRQLREDDKPADNANPNAPAAPPRPGV